MQRPDTFSVDQLLANQGWMRRLARGLAGDEADDLVQESWIAALGRPPTADRPAEPWLATVLRRLAGKRALATSRRRRREASEGVAAGTVASPEELVASAEAGRRVADLVLALPEPLRQVLLLRYYQGQSAVQVARSLGIPAATARWRTKRALDELRLRLAGQRGGPRRRRWAALLAPMAPWRPRPPLGRAPTRGAGAWSRWPIVALVSAVGALGAATLVGARWPGPRAGADAAAATAPVLTGARAIEARFGVAAAGLPRFLSPAEPAAGSAGGVLEGRVLDQAGAGVARAIVQGLRQDTHGGGGDGARPLAPVITGADGAFRFTGLVSGLYNLYASAPGLAVGSRVSLEVGADSPPTSVELRLAREGALLSGRVLDASAGVIPGAKVEIRGVSRLDVGSPPVSPAAIAFTLSSDEDGRFRVRLPRLGYRVKASADGYGSLQRIVELGGAGAADADEDADGDEDAGKELVLALVPSRPLIGRVITAGPNGRTPVGGAEVYALPVPDAARTAGDRAFPRFERTVAEADGRFRFARLPPGRYQLVARQLDLVGQAAAPVEVGDLNDVGDPTPVDLVLAPGLTVEGIVRRDGSPVARARVRLLAPGRPRQAPLLDHPVAVTGEDGRFVLTRILPGEYRLQVLDETWALRSDEPLSLRRSRTLELALRTAAQSPPSGPP